jgi:heme A synthase
LPGERRYLPMLKLTALLLVLMIVFGILSFVMHVAVALTKIAFFACLVGLVISVIGKAVRPG